jgi:hypothetical protein
MRGAAFPAQAPRPGLTLHLAYRDFRREIVIPPALAAVLFCLVPAILLACLGVGSYLTFRDDMLASLMHRQASMQFAY